MGSRTLHDKALRCARRRGCRQRPHRRKRRFLLGAGDQEKRVGRQARQQIAIGVGPAPGRQQNQDGGARRGVVRRGRPRRQKRPEARSDQTEPARVDARLLREKDEPGAHVALGGVQIVGQADAEGVRVGECLAGARAVAPQVDGEGPEALGRDGGRGRGAGRAAGTERVQEEDPSGRRHRRGRPTSRALRDTLRALGAEGGRAYAREVDRRIDAGLRDLVESDRRETEAAGATLVELRASDGQRLFGSLYRPRDSTGRGAVAATATTGGVLLLHPLGSSRAVCAASAAAVASEGLWALAIDLRGHGASASETLPDPHAFSVRLADNLDAAERDVRAGLVLLAQKPGVGARRLGIVGAGLGALLAARAASPDDTAPRPSVLALLSPWGRADAYRDLLSRLSPDSLLLVAGSEEEAPLATVRTLAAPTAAGAPQSLVVEGPGSHFELAGASPALIGTVASFLRSRLAREAGASGAGSRE